MWLYGVLPATAMVLYVVVGFCPQKPLYGVPAKAMVVCGYMGFYLVLYGYMGFSRKSHGFICGYMGFTRKSRSCFWLYGVLPAKAMVLYVVIWGFTCKSRGFMWIYGFYPQKPWFDVVVGFYPQKPWFYVVTHKSRAYKSGEISITMVRYPHKSHG